MTSTLYENIYLKHMRQQAIMKSRQSTNSQEKS